MKRTLLLAALVALAFSGPAWSDQPPSAVGISCPDCGIAGTSGDKIYSDSQLIEPDDDGPLGVLVNFGGEDFTQAVQEGDGIESRRPRPATSARSAVSSMARP